MNYIHSSKILVVNYSHELLTGVRQMEDVRGGARDLPGGELDPGETPLEGCLRELAEEAGRGLADYVAVEELYEDESPSKYGHINRRHFFWALADGYCPEPVVSNEHQAGSLQWVPLVEARRTLGHPVQRQAAAKLITKLELASSSYRPLVVA